MVFILTICFFVLTIIILATLLIKEKKHNKDINKKFHSIENSRNSSLEYIDALWESQKSIIMDEKLISLSTLVSRISHELNTPLGVTLTALSYIDDSIVKNTDPMIKLALSSLQKSISLVKTFSEISMEQNFDKAKEINISEFLEYTCCNIKFLNTKRDIPDDFTINTSQYNLSLIIQKIMDNAYDFSRDRENSEVVISATTDNDDLIISIKDNGTGIPKNDIGKIFDPLYTTRRDETHHGLGLAIAYNILTNQYNGKIECLSTIGQGTTITLSVPKVVSNKTLCTTS